MKNLGNAELRLRHGNHFVLILRPSILRNLLCLFLRDTLQVGVLRLDRTAEEKQKGPAKEAAA